MYRRNHIVRIKFIIGKKNWNTQGSTVFPHGKVLEDSKSSTGISDYNF